METCATDSSSLFSKWSHLSHCNISCGDETESTVAHDNGQEIFPSIIVHNKYTFKALRVYQDAVWRCKFHTYDAVASLQDVIGAPAECSRSNSDQEYWSAQITQQAVKKVKRFSVTNNWYNKHEV